MLREMASRKGSIAQELLHASVGRMKGRRLSMFRPSISFRGARAGTDSEMSEATHKPPKNVKYENSYKLEPDEGKVFVAYKVEKLMTDILETHLAKSEYDPLHSGKLAQDLCSIIKGRVKELGYERHKLIAQVVIGENKDQGFEIASRCLWSQTTDSWAATTFNNHSLFAIAVCFGVYLD